MTTQTYVTTDRPTHAAAVASLVVVGVALLWIHSPQRCPFGPDDPFADQSLLGDLHASVVSAVALGLGLAGLAAAGALSAGAHRAPAVRAAAIAVAAMNAIAFALIVPDIQMLILVAYAVTLSLPGAGVAVIVARALRGRVSRSARSASAGLAGLVTVAASVGWLLHTVHGASLGFRPLVLAGSMVVGLVWAVVLVRLLRQRAHRCLWCGRPGRRWTRPDRAAAWGRRSTWAAALCTLPYAMTRATWLTPWPLGIGASELAHSPGLRIFGLALAAAGEFGTWLTLGLIRPRGEIFPRWLPVIGGRPVPVRAAVVPGFSVALLLMVAGHSVVQQAFAPGSGLGDHLIVLLLPLPIWAPLLAGATLGYWYRRRARCRHCHLA